MTTLKQRLDSLIEKVGQKFLSLRSELYGELSLKALKTTNLTAGTGLTGGGSLAANRTICLSTATQSNIAKGVTAHGWGDHSQEGYATETYVDTEIDNIEIGGRNYFQYVYLSNRDNFNLGIYSRTKDTFQLEPNTEYTFYAKKLLAYEGGEWGVLNIRDGANYPETAGSIIVTVYNQKDAKPEIENFNVKFTTSGSGLIYFGFYDHNHGNSPDGQWFTDKLVEAQIFRGDKVLDWTPAPEDQITDWDETNEDSYSFLKNKPTSFPPIAHSHSWAQITGKPTTFPPTVHTHTIAQVTGLQTALDGKALKTTNLTSGTGLTGGGDLSSNRTIGLNSASQASLTKADSALQAEDIANKEDKANKATDMSVVDNIKYPTTALLYGYVKTELGAKTDKGGYIGTSQDLKNLIDGAVSGDRGVLYISDPTPTVDGYYKPQDEGTYPNGLTYEPSTTDANTIVTFILSDGVWTKNVVPIDVLSLSQDVTPLNTTKAISGLAAARNTINSAILAGSSILFNGVDAKMQLSKDYNLNTDGDFIEFKAEVLDFSSLGRYGLFGKKTIANEHDVGLTVGGITLKTYTIQVRGENSTWTEFLPLLEYKNNTYKIELTNSKTALNLYENGIIIDTKPFSGNSLIVRDVAQAYSTYYTKMNLKHFKINSSTDGVVSDLKAAILDSTFQYLETFSREINFKKTYVTFRVNGSSTGDGKLTVFSKINDSQYLGFDIEHEKDLAELKYNNQWRLTTAKIYNFDGYEMTDTGESFLQGGESESVYKRQGKDDFTGGYHGDEIFSSIAFYADDVKILDSVFLNNFNLMPCNEFSYNQISTTHTSPTGGVFASGHPIEAIRTKRTVFKNASYETNISYTWQLSISDFESVFGSMSSLSVGLANYGENSKLQNTPFNQDGTRRLFDIGGEWMRQYHLEKKQSVIIEPYSSVNNNGSEQHIWDVTIYHKYYRDINPNRDLSVNAGDVWRFKTKVSFFKE